MWSGPAGSVLQSRTGPGKASGRAGQDCGRAGGGPGRRSPSRALAGRPRFPAAWAFPSGRRASAKLATERTVRKKMGEREIMREQATARWSDSLLRTRLRSDISGFGWLLVPPTGPGGQHTGPDQQEAGITEDQVQSSQHTPCQTLCPTSGPPSIPRARVVASLSREAKAGSEGTVTCPGSHSAWWSS